MKLEIFARTIGDETLLDEEALEMVKKECNEILSRLRDALKVRMRSAFWQTTRSVENDA